MSISSAISSALLGLGFNALGAQIASGNIANAQTDGYGRRELVPMSQATRHGGILRDVDPVILADRRAVDAEIGYSESLDAAITRLATLRSEGQEDRLITALGAFQNALTIAAANPSADSRLVAIGSAAESLVGEINAQASALADLRQEAESRIARDVHTLNSALAKIADLNTRVSRAQPGSEHLATLLDLRQKEVDAISALVPVKLAERDRGVIALYTSARAVLLDGRPAEIGFTETPTIAPHMSLAGGLLSGLTLNGRNISTGPGGPLSGGALAASFALRDTHLPAHQARLDALASELASRFGPGGPDATFAPGDPGLFTDLGGPASPAPQVGLSGRLRLNPLVSATSTEPWRWRAGLMATGPGEVGDASLINALAARLDARSVPADPALGAVSKDIASLGLQLSSAIDGERVGLSDKLASVRGRHAVLREMELRRGVDSDQQLQTLLTIEKSYAANAKVLQTVDDMLLRILAI
ncbi:FlgK family flagellar hook-associated protein [Litorisediminicola beolgyonensis]|uniref:Flagellar hook-associated protein 1 n=1 Tax=Litorisediminicola beolgyonensis TaxID=1173614 RepID=A0ABW3ZGA5_9RHOB